LDCSAAHVTIRPKKSVVRCGFLARNGLGHLHSDRASLHENVQPMLRRTVSLAC
jgi:hypothetical protein